MHLTRLQELTLRGEESSRAMYDLLGSPMASVLPASLVTLRQISPAKMYLADGYR